MTTSGSSAGTSSPRRAHKAGSRAAPRSSMGVCLERTDAYGKHLFHRYAGAGWLHVHLGLIGSFITGIGVPPAPQGALRLRLVAAGCWLDLRGPMACEIVTPAERTVLIAKLGPDPLRRDADPDRAWARLSRSPAPVGQLMMDQAVVAGIGNVYRAELLYRHRVDPLRPGRDLAPATWVGMWSDLVALMRHGLRTGRIVTTRPEDRPRPRGRVSRDDAHYVYRRAGEACRVCGTPVATTVLAGRNLFWCPYCQT